MAKHKQKEEESAPEPVSEESAKEPESKSEPIKNSYAAPAH